MEFLKILSRLFLPLILILSLAGCSSGGLSGLEAFKSADGRYGFFYPTGWTRVAVSDGPEIVFHDLINSFETISLVVSDVGNEANLESLGTPDEVGERLISQVIAPSGSNRNADLVSSSKRDSSGHVFYDLEYIIHLPDRDRHEIASVVIDRGSLFTLAASTNETRWSNVSKLFEKVITSFTFFV